MCGIFGYVGREQNAAEQTLKGLKQLEYRGYDSWGVAFVPTNLATIQIEKHVGKIGDAQLQGENLISSLSIGHTRWATHGGVTEVNAHPHSASDGSFAVVHNGIIENFQEIKESLAAKGYEFKSQTDTEVFVHLVSELHKTLQFTEAVQQAFLQLHGLNAVVVLSKTENLFIAIRKGSPLVAGKNEDGFYVASDSTAIAEHVKDVYYLEDYDMIVCKANGIELFDVRTLQRKALAWQVLDFPIEQITKGEFPNFFLKEIHEQPRVLLNVADNLDTSVTEFAKKINHGTYFVGCGTASYAALLATYLFGEVAKMLTYSNNATEFLYQRQLLTPETFVTFISQSGETIDLVEHIPLLNEKKVEFGAIVNRLGSTLERAAKYKVLLPAGPEQAVLATKSFIAMYATLFLLAHAKVNHLEKAKEQLHQSISAVQELLTEEYKNNFVLPVVEKLVASEHAFVIGRGVSYPTAMETALKIKESTYLHAEGFAGGELKHGVIALIEKGTPCIILAPEDSEYESIISNAIELKTRGAFVIGVSSKKNDVFDLWSPTKDAGLSSGMLHVIVAQLIAYYLTVKIGNDPDKPRNLAKSVVVK